MVETYLQHPGLTLFMVTHDRYFLERVCNEIIELDNGQIYVYRGNYSDYLEKRKPENSMTPSIWKRQKNYSVRNWNGCADNHRHEVQKQVQN
jgi:ATP-binding cassette subfamily F protein uup